jgi:hypothetical protein
LQPVQRKTETASWSPIGDRSARCTIGVPQAAHGHAGAAKDVLVVDDMAAPKSRSTVLMMMPNEA